MPSAPTQPWRSSRPRLGVLLASPLAWLDRAVPPTLLLHGTGDAIVESLHSVLLEAQLKARGQTVELIVVPFGEHGFDMRPGGVGEQDSAPSHVALPEAHFPPRLIEG